MNCLKIARFVFYSILLLLLVQTVYYYPKLPEQMASHFNAAGEPDDWTGKQAFFFLMWGMYLLITLIFAAMGPLLSRIPESMVNLPNRGYWFAPERKAETVRVLSEYMLWMGSATLVLFLAIMHITVEANIGVDPGIGPPWLIIGSYLGFTVLWCIAFFLRFAGKPNRNDEC